MPIVYDA